MENVTTCLLKEKVAAQIKGFLERKEKGLDLGSHSKHRDGVGIRFEDRALEDTHVDQITSSAHCHS